MNAVRDPGNTCSMLRITRATHKADLPALDGREQMMRTSKDRVSAGTATEHAFLSGASQQLCAIAPTG